ncbi:MAG TPA: hypothetical protein VHU91_04200 [Mycobacteriales bacterium]|jgi:hypothetical protein|nr:hypothetical protein [Mycobacteriales bacterium]
MTDESGNLMWPEFLLLKGKQAFESGKISATNLIVEPLNAKSGSAPTRVVRISRAVPADMWHSS